MHACVHSDVMHGNRPNLTHKAITPNPIAMHAHVSLSLDCILVYHPVIGGGEGGAMELQPHLILREL